MMGCRAKMGICYAVESGWEQGHHTYCIYCSKKQGSEGKEGMDKRVMKGEIRIFLKKG